MTPQSKQYETISFKCKDLLKRSLVIIGSTSLLLFSFSFLFAQEGNLSGKIDQKLFSTSTLMWYTKPAAQWEEALPVGNGRLGAMVYGRTNEEIIQLNEDTYWSGSRGWLRSDEQLDRPFGQDRLEPK